MIHDVAVIGLGLSGASAAISLARRGVQVLALEAGDFPRHKVCGEFLSPESKSTLARLGALQILEESAHLIHRAQIFAPDGRSLTTEIPNTALSISRFILDGVLAQIARECGVEVRVSHRVRRVKREGNLWRIEVSHNGETREFRARHVLGAPGRHANWLQNPNSSRMRYVGFKTHFADANLAPHTVELHAWRGGYCGASQIENGLVNACLLARYDAINGRKPEDFWRDLLEKLPLLRERFQSATPQMEWLATANVQFAPPSPLRESASTSTCAAPLMCAGDAAGFIHPLTGDGMAMALRSGELAAAVLFASLRANITQRDAETMYRAAWQREFGARLRWATWLQRLLIEPEFAAPVLSIGARVPALGQFIVAKTRGRAV